MGKPPEESRVNTTPVSSPVVAPASSAASNFHRKRMSDAEINRRRELSLCFKCEEKFGPNHKCKNRQLRLIMLEDEEGDGLDTGDETQVEGNDPLGKELDSMELVITSVVGLSGKKTLKMVGLVKGE